MNTQIPLPSFDDIRRILNFWFDQQDKWFYFETGMFQTGINGKIEKREVAYAINQDLTNEIFQ